MKKLILGMVAIITSVVLIAGCGGNNIKDAKQDLPSERYTAEEIDTAKDIVIKDFESGSENWQGCTLLSIYYPGDKHIEEYYSGWEERYNADEIIVLVSCFKTDKNIPLGPLEPDEVYDGYNFILARSNGGEWVIVECGYA